MRLTLFALLVASVVAALQIDAAHLREQRRRQRANDSVTCSFCAAVQGTPLFDFFLCAQICPSGSPQGSAPVKRS